MFEHSLLPFGDSRERRRTRWIVALSLSTQGAAILFLVVMPLLYPAQMPLFRFAHLKRVELVRPMPPVPPKPVIVKVANASTLRTPSIEAPTHTAALTVRTARPELAEPPLLPYGDSRMNGPAVTSILGIASATSPGIKVSVKSASDGARAGGEPVRLSSGVTSGMLLAPIRPAYPRIAKLTRTEGTVVVAAFIDTQGRIIGLITLSGPAMLRPAAEDAVREARYKPYLLNGQPVEVETTISVNFRMGI